MIEKIKGISKRRKFVIVTLVLFLGLFGSEYLDFGARIVSILALSLLASLSLFVVLYQDIKSSLKNYSVLAGLFLLPFLYTLAFGSFYFLLPARFLTRITLSTLFAVGLYALYLSHNIYAVAGIRTIQLLNAAHSVGFLLILVTFFFLSNIIFSLHLVPPLALLLVFLLSLILIFQVIWSVNLEEKITKTILTLVLVLALVVTELSLVLNFWPVSPTVAALFLSGNFYTFVGLSQAWLERRLFKNTLWEYVGVAIIVFLLLMTRTKWGG